MANSQFSGSRLETDFTPLLESFFTQVIPKIQDIAELKAILYTLYLIYRKHVAKPQRKELSKFSSNDLTEGQKFATKLQSFVTYKELKAVTCQLSDELDEETLRRALNSAVDHGTLLHSTLKINGESQDVYFLKAESCQPPAVNIFALYEQNIGIITPMIAAELKEAERLYPAQWIDEAFKEAVVMNKRNWKYIARILERWASEGKDSGKHRQDIKKGSPDKYIKGKYGHLVQR
jgi:DnaD/phage-associated family protein